MRYRFYILSFLIGFIAGGIVLYSYYVPSMKVLATTQAELKQTTNKAKGQDIAINSLQNQVKQLRNMPTPTPIIVYHAQNVTQPTAETTSENSGIPGVSKAQMSCWLFTGSARGCPQN